VSEVLANDKLVFREGCSEGSQTAKSGTDEQKRHMRLRNKEEPACRGAARKRKNLIRLGVDLDHAYQWSRSRMGGWAIAQSPILNTTITVAKLTQRGYESLLTHYYKVSPHYQSSPLFGFADFQFPLFNEPHSTRPVCYVV